MFKIGDKVVLKDESQEAFGLKVGVVYTVDWAEPEYEWRGSPLISVVEFKEEGFEKVSAGRFVLANETNIPVDPSKQHFPVGSKVISKEKSFDINVGDIFTVLPTSLNVVFRDNAGNVRVRPVERYKLVELPTEEALKEQLEGCVELVS